MSEKRHEDDLRRLLQRGDPAADDNGMTPDEIAEMRRAILAEADRPSQQGLLPFLSVLMRPLPAAATAVAVLILAALWLYPWEPSRPTFPGSGGPAVADAPPLTPPEPTGGQEATAPAPEEPAPLAPTPAASEPVAEARSAERIPETSIVEPSPQRELVVDTEPVADRQARTVLFTSPLGTRIIWTLDPEFESPLAEPGAREEQGK